MKLATEKVKHNKRLSVRVPSRLMDLFNRSFQSPRIRFYQTQLGWVGDNQAIKKIIDFFLLKTKIGSMILLYFRLHLIFFLFFIYPVPFSYYELIKSKFWLKI